MSATNSYLIGTPNSGSMTSFNTAIKAVQSVWTPSMDESVAYYVSKAQVGVPVVLCIKGIRVATLMTMGSTTSTNPQSNVGDIKGSPLNGG